MVAITPPPPHQKPQPVFHSVSLDTPFVRLYDPAKYSATALSFRHYGPISRFDHQPEPLALHPSRAILYAASRLSGCLVEVFGDTKIIDVGNWEVALIACTRTLNLLDLRGPNAMKAGTVSGVCKESNRRYSQEWSRYFYGNSFLYEPEAGVQIDGLLFGNAHNDEDAFAFYERCEKDFACRAACPLNAPALRAEIQFIALETCMYVQPY